jgi:hypothetical protein
MRRGNIPPHQDTGQGPRGRGRGRPRPLYDDEDDEVVYLPTPSNTRLYRRETQYDDQRETTRPRMEYYDYEDEQPRAGPSRAPRPPPPLPHPLPPRRNDYHDEAMSAQRRNDYHDETMSAPRRRDEYDDYQENQYDEEIAQMQRRLNSYVQNRQKRTRPAPLMQPHPYDEEDDNKMSSGSGPPPAKQGSAE